MKSPKEEFISCNSVCHYKGCYPLKHLVWKLQTLNCIHRKQVVQYFAVTHTRILFFMISYIVSTDKFKIRRNSAVSMGIYFVTKSQITDLVIFISKHQRR